MKPVIGQLYHWHPEDIVGMDGQTYPVFTTFASGRGWASKQYYTPREGWIDYTPIVRILAKDTYQKRNCVCVDIIQGHDMLVNCFNKRPYVRKDGTFRVIDTEDYYDGAPKLGNKYGVTRTEDYLWKPNNDYDGLSYMEHFYKTDIELGHFKKGELYYITNIIVKKGTLTPVVD